MRRQQNQTHKFITVKQYDRSRSLEAYQEIILCKYGEIALKGANRRYFEDLLCRNLKRRLERFGDFAVERSQSTIRIIPRDEFFDIDGAYAQTKKVFGLVGVSRAAVCAKDTDTICDTLRHWCKTQLADVRTFKVEAKRSDKTFPLNSPQLCQLCGGVILEAMPRLHVDVHHPDVVVRVEIRDTAAYMHAGQDKGAGGMPIGSNGKGLLLLSGGIDSPVAGYMMAKRGVQIEGLHFESMPYTSDRAREKVVSLAQKMTEYCGDIRLHVVSVTHIQEELMRRCDQDYFTLLLRRFMMRLANLVAARNHCSALITGESLGQVASQTIQALGVTNALAEYPVFRPCIGMDKEEIITVARKIDTFDLSVLPYEDCCTVFTPRHPRTRPEMAKVEAQEEKVDVLSLQEEALSTLYTIDVKR